MFSMFDRLAGGNGRGAKRCVAAACGFVLEGLETRQLLSGTVESLAAPAPYEPPMAAVLAAGTPAPNFTLPYHNLLGTYTLNADPNTVQVLTFFATWSGLSQQTAPQIQEIYDWAVLNTLPVSVIMINQNETPAEVDQFILDHNLVLPILMDTQNVGPGLYDTLSLPVTYVITDGEIRHVHIGINPDLVTTIEGEIDTILNTPVVSVTDVTVFESAATADFTVALSSPSDVDITVTYSVTGGTATLNGDFEVSILDPIPLILDVTFAAGETEQIIQIPIINDLLEEPAEQFFVVLTNATNAIIADGTGVGTIIDDDTPPDSVLINITDETVVEGDEGSTMMVFTVTMSALLPFDLTVDYTTSDGLTGAPATAGEDYEITFGTLTFAAGETVKTIEVPIFGDTADEPYETLDLTLSNVLRVLDPELPPPNPADPPLPVPTLVKDVGIGTIQDDEPFLYVGGDIVVSEGDAGTTLVDFVISLSSPATEPVTVEYATVNDTAIVVLDFVGQRTTVAFDVDELEKTIQIAIVGDLLAEPDESFFVRLVSSTGAAIKADQSQGMITILNETDVAPPTPTVSISDAYGVIEGEAGAALNFTISLSTASLEDVRVRYTIAGGTATPDIDYVSLPSQVVIIPAGQTSYIVSVPVIDDLLAEANETVIVTLTDPLLAIPGNMVATGIIVEDEVAPTITIADTFMTEGNVYNNTMVFTVSLSQPSGQAVTVNYTTLNGTANATDYEPGVGTLVFEPGELSRTVRVMVHADRSVEDNEYFFVSLSGETGATIARGAGVGTIVDDDRFAKAVVRNERGFYIADNRRRPPVSFGKYVVGEYGAILTFTVTNQGSGELRLGKVVVPKGFKLIDGLRNPLAPSESDTFQVQVLTNRPGVRAGHIRFATSDPKAKPYNFAVSARINDTDAARSAREARTASSLARATSAEVMTAPAKSRLASLFAVEAKGISADWLTDEQA